MSGIRISHIGLCVSKLDAALHFYCEGLGFAAAEAYDVGPTFADALEVPSPSSVRSQMIVKDGLTIELLDWTTPPAEGSPSSARNQLGMTHLALNVDDPDAVAASLVAVGGTVLNDTRTVVDLGGARLTLLFVADPDGNRVELMGTATS
jgi:lactoylglutathione lyase